MNLWVFAIWYRDMEKLQKAQLIHFIAGFMLVQIQIILHGFLKQLGGIMRLKQIRTCFPFVIILQNIKTRPDTLIKPDILIKPDG